MKSTTSKVSLIGTPYGMGQRGFKFGAGPLALLAADRLPMRLAEEQVAYSLAWVDADEPSGGTIQLPEGDQLARYLQQNYVIQELVKEARSKGEFPLLSSGSCTTSLGVLGGLDDDGVGVIWIDAHADASTPETSGSGFIDGMPVAMINGRCWKAYRESIPGFHIVPEDRILSVGMHDLRPNRPGPIGRVVDRDAATQAGSWLAALTQALDELATHTDRVYVHFDTDALDARVAWVHQWAAEGGLSPEEIKDTLGAIFERFTVLALNFTAFDPSVDERALPIIESIACLVAELATAKASST